MGEPAKNRKEPEEGDDDSSRDYKHRQTILIIALVIVMVGFIIAVAAGLILNEYYKDDRVSAQLTERKEVLVDCLPGLRRNEEKMRKSEKDCVKRGCLWKPQKGKGAPWCLFPKGHDYVTKSKVTTDADGKNMTLELKRGAPASRTSGVDQIFDEVTISVQIQTNNRLRIKLYPTSINRWEIPDSMLDIEKSNDVTANSSTSLFNVTIEENPIGVVVTRKDTGTVVFNSSLPGTLLANQFLQLTTTLPSGNLYGFGEHRHLSLRHNMNWTSWAMFTRDAGPDSNWNLYGQHPVYLNIEDDGKANMVLLKNSNAMEVLLQPEPYPAVTFTTIGGVLDFYVYIGDSPADVTSHYIKSIGLPAFPPYWSLGYHLCRWGYRNISDMRSVMDRTIAAKIPYDAQWADIDTFYKYYPFTFDPVNWASFPAFVDELHSKGMHFVPIVDPGVGTNQTIATEIRFLSRGMEKYEMLSSGNQDNIFIKSAVGNGFEPSEVWPGPTFFPDFTDPKSEAWWKKQILHYVQDVKIKVDALWIDMNEPSSFIPKDKMNCRNNTWNYPNYCPNILGAGDDCVMFDKTICMDSKQSVSNHYNAHSLYGHTMAMRTYNALYKLGENVNYYENKRPWTMTRSSFVGTGKFATKWMGDNKATWDDMKNSIVSIIEFGFFGFAMNGADICGFWNEPSAELCIRWHQLGAFYPFARNHNGRGDEPNFFKHQDPASFGQDFVDIIRPTLMTRYRLLPYIYTSMYRAHNDGRMVMQPLFYQFPLDKNTLTIDRQFMLGDSLLVSPVLEEGSTSVKAYFPDGRWFDYLTGEEILSTGGKTVDLATPLTKFNLHIRGGQVIPWQEPDVTTTKSRLNDLGLIVALDKTGKASGELFWDDGKSNLGRDKFKIIKFDMEKAGTLNLTSEGSSFKSSLKFQTIEIYGLPRIPSKVTVEVNGKAVTGIQHKLVSERVVQISGINHPVASTTQKTVTTVTWSLF